MDVLKQATMMDYTLDTIIAAFLLNPDGGKTKDTFTFDKLLDTYKVSSNPLGLLIDQFKADLIACYELMEVLRSKLKVINNIIILDFYFIFRLYF